MMPSTPQNLRILVVDDDDVSRTVLHEHLRAAGHDVVLAPDVATAITVLQREPVQIIVADWIMPKASGLDLCHWVRRQPFGQTVHFVMLTVLTDKRKLIEAFRAGVDDFLSKPLHEGELFARLNAWGRIVRLQQQLDERHKAALRANEQLVSLNGKLADLATRDELTGLPNRREACRRLHEQWEIAARYEQPLSCAVIDADHFKRINDTWGHRAGDETLKELANRLAGTLRKSDEIFRIGGDEFLVILPCTPLPDAQTWAQRTRETARSRPVDVASAEFAVSVTIGVAERTATMRHWQEMVDAADRTLLKNKEARRVESAARTDPRAA